MSNTWAEQMVYKYHKEIQKLTKERNQLKQQLAESEKNFIVANNLRKNSDEVLLNYKTEKYGLDKTIQELRKIKLSFPEKEWYYKGFENCERQMSSHIADLTLEVKELKQQLAESESENKQLIKALNGETFINYKLPMENAKLKQQLAESNEGHHKNIVELTKIATEKDRKIDELKQQLAEKEKEIDWLKEGK